MTLAIEIAQFVHETGIEDFSKEVIEKGKQCILDTIGATLLGLSYPASNISLDLVKEMGGAEQALILGRAMRVPVYWAALVNGISGHVADYDDSSPVFKGHPSCVLLPASLAAAEYVNTGGAQLLEGFILGNEVGSKLGQIMGWQHYDMGWHGTGTIGTIAASVAVAKILKLKPKEIVSAIGIAASSASGIRQNFGTMTKSFHAGHAAASGVMSAFLASKGYGASSQSLEGASGFIKVFYGNGPVKFKEELGEKYSILDLAFKKYPSCAGTHAAVEAAKYLREIYSIQPEQIEKVECYARPVTKSILIHNNPQNDLEAKFSMQYCLAATLAKGSLGLSDFEDMAVQRSEVRSLMPKIHFNAEPDFEQICIDKNLLAPARIRIISKTGSIVEHTVWEASGGPSEPLNWSDLEKKFVECATTVMSAGQAKAVNNMVREIDMVANIKKLTDLLSR